MNAPAMIEKKNFWNERLLPYCKADDRSAILQLATTAGLFAVTWWGMLQSLAIGWWLALVIAPLAAGLLVRLFIIQHDCGHGSFFSSRKANDRVGTALGILTLTPFHWWKRAHAIHHAGSGNLDRRSVGDISTLTVSEYLALPWRGRLGYRLYRNPLVLLVIGPIWIFVIKHRLPIGTPLSWRREWRDVLLNDAALIAIVALAWQTIGLGPFLMIHGPIFLISAAAGVWLFYVSTSSRTRSGRRRPTGTSSTPASREAPSTTCRRSCTGSPGTSGTTMSTTSPAAFRTTSWCAASGKSRSCSGSLAWDCSGASAACA